MLQLAKTLKLHPQVKTIFYSDPDELNIPETKIPYRGRSLFDNTGNAFRGVTAWKSIN
jgi:arabinogalactan endo-1,4-beta-galactosidase